MITTVKLANASITSYRICVCMCGVNFENLFLWSVSNKQFSTACYSHHVLQSNPKTYFITGSLHLLTTFPHFLLPSTACHWQPPNCSLSLSLFFIFLDLSFLLNPLKPFQISLQILFQFHSLYLLTFRK